MSSKKKKQRLMLLACVKEEEEGEGEDSKAQEVLKKIGFDSEDVTQECRIGFWSAKRSVTPMIYFSENRDFKMCRYLFSRCADCWKTDELGCCPMFCAAANGHVEVVEWLFHHGGAKDDVRKPNMSGNSPLFMALYNDYMEVGKRLILNGALFSRYNGVVIDARIMRNDLRPVSGIVWNDDKRLSLLSWAQDAVT